MRLTTGQKKTAGLGSEAVSKTQTPEAHTNSCTKPGILKIHAILCGLINSTAAVLFGLAVLTVWGGRYV